MFLPGLKMLPSGGTTELYCGRGCELLEGSSGFGQGQFEGLWVLGDAMCGISSSVLGLPIDASETYSESELGSDEKHSRL